ncbi:MAG: hypothetical protein GXP16_20175 [Gammaproteobacteria bacterium]|nr:hypothetical protein [Gammaproteobacteria bacterium]
MWSKIKSIFCKSSDGVASEVNYISSDRIWDNRDPSKIYVVIAMESGHGFTPIMGGDSDYLQLNAGQELSFKYLEDAQIYCTSEMGMMRNNTPGHDEDGGKTPLAINFLKNRKNLASCSWNELKVKKDRLYDIDNIRQVHQNKEVMAEAIKATWGS